MACKSDVVPRSALGKKAKGVWSGKKVLQEEELRRFPNLSSLFLCWSWKEAMIR
jgi:hypothetical protein